MAFRDFVLSRMRALDFPVEAAPAVPEDVEWETWETLRLIPNPDLEAGSQEAVRMDFAIPEQGLELKVRRAMLPYTLEHLRLPGAAWSGRPFLIQKPI